MKVCDISSFYSDLGGGVRTYHHQKLAYFARHPEHRYSMVIAGPQNEERTVPGGRVYNVRGVPVSRGAVYRQIVDYFELRRVLHVERPDVVEIGSAYLDCWLGMAGGMGWDPVVVGLYHADFPDSYMAPAVAGFPRAVSRPFVRFWQEYVRFTYGRFDATCVTSSYVQQKLKGYGLDNTRLVPLGVDGERFNPRFRDEAWRTRLGVGSGERLVLYVGRFSSEKGMDALAEALPLLAQRQGLHVVLVGSGSLEPQLRAIADASPRQHVLGYLSDPAELARVYASADLFLAPGPYETFGLSTVEAMASGLPVVGAANGGSGETVGQSGTGRLFTPGRADELVRCVDELLTTDLREMGARARAFVERTYSWELTFSRLTDVYEELLDAKRSRAGLAARRDAGLRAGDPAGPVPSAGVGSLPSGAARGPESPRHVPAL